VSASRPLDRGQRRILGTASIADNRLFVRDADATAFLNALEPSPRALICTVVYAVIRGGVTDPQRVLAEVTARLQERGRDPRVPPIARRIDQDHAGAMAFVGRCLRKERRTPQRGRVQRTQQAPATEKQVAYLRALGYKGEGLGLTVTGASELIDKLVRINTSCESR